MCMGDNREEQTSERRAVEMEPASTAGKNSAQTSPPPPKPDMSDSTPAPTRGPVPVSRTVKLAKLLWIVSFLSGLVVVVVTFMDRDIHLERLRALVTERDPSRNTETFEAVATIVFWGSLGGLLLVILIEAILLSIMMRRHSWARWALLMVLLLHAGVMVVASAFLIPPDDKGMYILLLLVTQTLLATAALIASLLPSSGVWFHPKQERSSRPRT